MEAQGVTKIAPDDQAELREVLLDEGPVKAVRLTDQLDFLIGSVRLHHVGDGIATYTDQDEQDDGEAQ